MEIHHLGIIIPKKNYEKIKIIFYLWYVYITFSEYTFNLFLNYKIYWKFFFLYLFNLNVFNMENFWIYQKYFKYK